MKAAFIFAGSVYRAKVSGRVVRVRVLRTRDQSTARGYRQCWEAENLETGRVIVIRSAQRLRPLPEREPMGHAATRACENSGQ